MTIFGKSRVVLALGGGGSRGLAHLGVLRVLAREGIPIDGVVGTSVGAIVAGAYANSPDVESLIESSLDYLRSDRFQKDQFRRVMFGANDVEASPLASLYRGIRKSLSFTALIRRKSVFPHERLAEVVAEFVPDVDFEELAIPFGVPAIDLKQPREVMLTEGSLRTAVTASCSLPGFFPPVELDDMLLADVGVIGSVPVDAARELMPGALVIAVDLSTELEPIEDINRGWEAILRCEVIASQKLKDLELERADVVVRPRLGVKYWSDFTELQRMIDAGAVATEAVLPQLRSKLDGLKRFLRVRNPSHHDVSHDETESGSPPADEAATTESSSQGAE